MLEWAKKENARPQRAFSSRRFVITMAQIERVERAAAGKQTWEGCATWEHEVKPARRRDPKRQSRVLHRTEGSGHRAGAAVRDVHMCIRQQTFRMYRAEVCTVKKQTSPQLELGVLIFLPWQSSKSWKTQKIWVVWAAPSLDDPGAVHVARCIRPSGHLVSLLGGLLLGHETRLSKHSMIEITENTSVHTEIKLETNIKYIQQNHKCMEIST